MSLDTLLDDRKVIILKAIIKTYLEIGEPVDFRTISRYLDLKLSFATIQSGMSDLEEVGYIVQLYTSTGRIPPDKGYRLYVDQIMLDKEGEATEFKEMMVQKVDKLELILKKVTRASAANINYTTTISDPSYCKIKFKFTQLPRMRKHKFLVVVVVEGNIIKDTMINIKDNLSDEELLNLNILSDNSLGGLTVEGINLDVISKLKGDTNIHNQVVNLAPNEVAEVIKTREEDLQTYTNGATNIFKYPELPDGDKASRLADTLEHKEVLQELVAEVNSDTEEEADIQVYIGDENPVQSMKDCSVVITNYDLGGGLRGAVSIIGPKRMNYEKVPETPRSLMNQLDTAFKKDGG